eukprot:GHVU01036037.1.p2 GENE.GHVU01036037.1~~GHVU01036037.1.p2  ORF type:complete len:165 (+),score=30.37 GHVU01036037.1:307-801(+)
MSFSRRAAGALNRPRPLFGWTASTPSPPSDTTARTRSHPPTRAPQRHPFVPLSALLSSSLSRSPASSAPLSHARDPSLAYLPFLRLIFHLSIPVIMLPPFPPVALRILLRVHLLLLLVLILFFFFYLLLLLLLFLLFLHLLLLLLHLLLLLSSCSSSCSSFSCG